MAVTRALHNCVTPDCGSEPRVSGQNWQKTLNYVQRAAEALAQSHRPAQRLASREFGLAHQKSADGAKHDRQRRAPGGRVATNDLPLAPMDLTT